CRIQSVRWSQRHSYFRDLVAARVYVDRIELSGTTFLGSPSRLNLASAQIRPPNFCGVPAARDLDNPARPEIDNDCIFVNLGESAGAILASGADCYVDDLPVTAPK